MPVSSAQASRSVASTDAFRGIVQQVRSGQKTNAEMFEALKELARKNTEHNQQNSAETPQSLRAHEAPEGSSTSNLYANSAQLAKFSPQDRKRLVSKIIEQRRSQQRRRNQSWMPGVASEVLDSSHPRIGQDIIPRSEQNSTGEESNDTDDSSAVEHRQRRHSMPRKETHAAVHRSYDESSDEDEEYDEGNQFGREGDGNYDGGDDSDEDELEEDDKTEPAIGPASRKQPQFSDEWNEHVDELIDEEDSGIQRTASMYMMGSQKFRDSQGGTLDDSGMRRSKRFSRSLIDIREEVWKDCTFKPSIKKLPSYYGPKKEEQEPFYDRVMRWSQTRESDAEQQREKAARKETAGCTFTPKLNANSKRAVQAIRSDTELNASERLYKQIAVIQQNKLRREDEHERKQREAEEKVCTFQPKLMSSPKYREPHQSNFMERSRSWAEKSTMSRKQTDSIEYPFHPKINGVKDTMTAARLYTGTPVVERLTRNYASDDSFIDDGTLDRPSMDARSFIGSIQGNRPRSAPHSRASRELTPAEQRQRQKAFQMFLARQNNTLVRKESKIKAMAQQQLSNFQPQLCKRSLDMTEEHNKGTFLHRLERDQLKREHDTQRKEILSKATAHSYQPEVTNKSAKLRPRTVHEMSRGDLMKKETNQRLLRLRMEQAQLSEMTFKPRISNVGQVNNGKLKLSASTEHYLATIKAMQQRKQEKALRVHQQREVNELEGCTFNPTTIECPTYIQRISQSMRIAKSMRSTDQAPTRPDWR